jgi:hypothetical protein
MEAVVDIGDLSAFYDMKTALSPLVTAKWADHVIGICVTAREPLYPKERAHVCNRKWFYFHPSTSNSRFQVHANAAVRHK